MKLYLTCTLATLLLLLGSISCSNDEDNGASDGCEEICQHLDACDGIPCLDSDIEICKSNYENKSADCKAEYRQYVDCVVNTGCGDFTACTTAYQDTGC